MDRFTPHHAAPSHAPTTESSTGFTVSPEAEAELHWFFNEAEVLIGVPSNFMAILSGRHATTIEEADNRANAVHVAGLIWRRLLQLPGNGLDILQGLYTERVWPLTIAHALGSMAGVIEAMATVKAEYMTAWMQRQTNAPDVTAWLEEHAQRGSPLLIAWHEEAKRACTRALADYQKVRGQGPSLVPQEVL
jgi:hypothetical protein